MSFLVCGLSPLEKGICEALFISSLIIVTTGISKSNFLEDLSYQISKKYNGLHRMLLLSTLSLILGFSVMNDTALLILVPLIVSLYNDKTERLTNIALVSIGANIGSMASPYGNPQNIIIWKHYDIPPHNFLLQMIIWSIPAILLLYGYTVLVYKLASDKISDTTSKKDQIAPINKRLASLSITLLIVLLILGAFDADLPALVLTLAVFALTYPSVLKETDHKLILLFLTVIPVLNIIAQSVSVPVLGSGNLGLLLSTQLYSLIVSNVPATVLLVNKYSNWLLLAVGVNIVGVATVVSSIANLISIRLGDISINEFHKFTVPYYMVVLVVYLMLILL